MANLKCNHCAERKNSCDPVILCEECLDSLSENEWISVKDSLPEEATDRVLVCDAFTKNQAVGFMSDGYINCWDDMFDDAITHWMPLPEPPKESE